MTDADRIIKLEAEATMFDENIKAFVRRELKMQDTIFELRKKVAKLSSQATAP